MSKQTKFEMIISDHDTALFRAAKFVQEDYILVTNIKSGVVKEFKNKTTFYGHHSKKEGGYLGDINTFLGNVATPEDFTIEECVRLCPDIENHLAEAEKTFDYSVGAIKKTGFAEDYRLVIGGGENFRYGLAQEIPYKGTRLEKPLLFAELKEIILEKYKNKIILTDGKEADDELSKFAFENYLHYTKTKEWKYLLQYIDKDIKMCVSPHINPDKLEEGIQYNSPNEAARCYAIQLLTGDTAVDNIPSLPNISEELREKYGVRKGRGVGKTTAENLLKDCKKPVELFSRVCEAYKDYYGPRKQHKFTNFRDEELSWTWRDFITNRAKLLWMYRDESTDYDVFRDTFDKLKVKY